MRRTLLACAATAFLSSCMYAEGNAQTGTWRIAAVGTDVKKHDIGASGWKADDVNNSTATDKVTNGVITKAKWALAGKGLDTVKDLGGNVIDSTLR